MVELRCCCRHCPANYSDVVVVDLVVPPPLAFHAVSLLLDLSFRLLGLVRLLLLLLLALPEKTTSRFQNSQSFFPEYSKNPSKQNGPKQKSKG